MHSFIVFDFRRILEMKIAAWKLCINKLRIFCLILLVISLKLIKELSFRC